MIFLSNGLGAVIGWTLGTFCWNALFNKPDKIRQQGKPVLDIDPEEEREKRYKNAQYRNLVLRSVATFCVGIILMAFLEATGLGGFLFGLALFLLGGLFFKCL